MNKKEIKIRFFETNLEGNQIWEAFGNFNETDVHHQVSQKKFEFEFEFFYTRIIFINKKLGCNCIPYSCL